MPPDSSCGNIRATRGAESDLAQQVRHHPPQLGPVGVAVLADHVEELVLDPHDRVEAVHRALRHVGEVAPADLPQRRVVDREQVDGGSPLTGRKNGSGPPAM